MNEAALQRLVVDAAEAHGLLTYHTFDSRRSNPGFPDLVIVGANGVLYAELKSATGRLSPMQVYWLDSLTAAGQNVRLWRPEHWPHVVVQDLRALGRTSVQLPAPSQAEVRRKLSARRSK